MPNGKLTAYCLNSFPGCFSLISLFNSVISRLREWPKVTQHLYFKKKSITFYYVFKRFAMDQDDDSKKTSNINLPSTNKRKKSSLKTSIWLGIGLLAIILLLVIFIPCPSASQYFVFRIIIAIAAAGLATVIPGTLSIEIANGVKAGGALAIFAIIYFFDPASTVATNKCVDETFDLTVFVHGKGGLEDKILKDQGWVCVYLNSKPEKVKIDGDGKATFTEISPTFLNSKVRITIDHPQPYQSTHPDSMYELKKNAVVYLETALMGTDKIFGEVVDYKTGQFIDSVRVSIFDIATYTNANGWFELKIPSDKQFKFQRVSFDKMGYERVVFDSVPVHTRQQMSLTMKRLMQ